jgi:hypothetical protein
VIGPEHERRAAGEGPAFSDAVTFAWADAESGVCGLARLGMSPGPLGSALAIVFSGGAPAGVLAEGGLQLEESADWPSLAVAGLRATVEEPLRRWTVSGAVASAPFALEFEALGDPAEFELAGMRGYEQLCAVNGTAAGVPVACLGQRGHSWGDPDWQRHQLGRTVTAWLEDGTGLTLSAFRPSAARTHAEEEMACAFLGGGGPRPVAEPRLSTTYDGEGRQLRAGLELWATGDEDDYPHRGAGRVICGSTLDLGQLQLDCAFFEWTLDGRRGLGRYDILRR